MSYANIAMFAMVITMLVYSLWWVHRATMLITEPPADGRVEILHHIHKLQDQLALYGRGMDRPADPQLTAELVDMLNRNWDNIPEGSKHRISDATRNKLLGRCLACENNAKTAGAQFEELCHMSSQLTGEIHKEFFEWK